MPHGRLDWALEALSVARIVFYSIDCATGFMVRSDNCSDILGMPSAGPVTSWVAAISPEDRSQYEDTRSKLSPEQPGFEVEYRLPHAGSATPFWALDRGSGEFDSEGRLTGIRGAIIDVSARVGIERELRQAATLRSVVFEAARMAAWHFDVATDRFTCTDELLTLLDIDRQHFDGSARALEDAIHPDDRAAWRKAHDEARLSGSRMEIEFRLLARAQSCAGSLSRGEFVRRQDGAPLESIRRDDRHH